MGGLAKSIRMWALTLAVFAPGAEATAGGATCVSCDTRLVLTESEAACVERRLDTYLAEARDPVLISVVGCDGRNRDSRRLEPPVRIFSSAASIAARANGAKDAYLIRRSDAQCLLQRLKSRHKARAIIVDLSAC